MNEPVPVPTPAPPPDPIQGATGVAVPDAGPAPPPDPATTPFAGLSATPGMIAVTTPDGGVSQVRLEDARQAIAAGAHVATEQEYYKANENPLWAGAEGVLRGATFGLSDKALIEGARHVSGDGMAEQFRKGLAISKEAHPDASLGGEIVGSLAPMLIPGLQGEAALEDGSSLLARFGARALSAAPRAAIEGAAFGAGHELSEDALGAHDVTAEKLLAATGKGFVFGGLLGGGLHAGGGLLGDLVLGTGSRAAATLAEKEAVGGATKAATSEGEKGATMKWLSELRDEQAAKSLLPGSTINAGELQKLGRTTEEQMTRLRRIGSTATEEGVGGAFASKNDLANQVKAALGKSEDRLAEMRAPLDKSTIRPSLAGIAKTTAGEIIEPLSQRPMTGKAQQVVSDWVDELGRISKGEDPSFKQLFNFRVELDNRLKDIKYNKIAGQTVSGEANALSQLRGIVEKEYVAAADKAAQEVGGDFSSKYLLEKQKYADLKTAQTWVTKSAARGAQNRSISLSDTVMAGAALASGHPLALLAPVVNKVVRTYGNQIATDVLTRATKLEGVQRAAIHFDGLVTKGVRGFLDGGETAAVKGTQTKTKVTADTVQQLREATRDPMAVNARTADILGAYNLRQSAPNVTQAMASTIQRAAAYIYQTAPQERQPVGVSLVPQKPRPPSATELQRFQDVIDTVNDPLSVVSDMQKGRLNRTKVEALRNVYPRIYESVRTELAKQAIDLRPTLSTQQEIALSVMFDEPLSATMRPDIRNAFQATYSAQGAKPDPAMAGGNGPNPPKGPLQRTTSMASTYDNLEAPQ